MLKRFIFYIQSVFVFLFLFSFLSCYKVIYVEDISGIKLSKINTKENKNAIFVIDTRPYSEYKKGHLNYAVNIPFEEMEERIADIEDKKNYPIYIYGASDDLSFKAAQLLVEKGFKKIFNAEGINQYKYNLIKYDIIRANEIKKYQKKYNAFIVDYRTKQAFIDEHFDGSVSIPIGAISEYMEILPKDKNRMVIFYCNTGISSVWGAEELMSLGYTNVAAVLEGILEDEFRKEMYGEKNR